MKLSLLTLLIFSHHLNAQLCSKWGQSREIGYLNHEFINEASGIAVSQYPNRLYHINDSGDGPFFYQTTFSGRRTKKIKIEGFNPIDVESMAYGSCGKENCLVIADIGDNKEKRESVSFVVIEDKKYFSDSIKPRSIIKAVYPDRPHNTEGVALHPNGDIYILTKEVDSTNNRANPSSIFVLKKEQWMQKSQEIQKLEYVGELDLPYQLYDYNLRGRIVTGFDINSDGSKLLISTYKVALEINMDLSRKEVINLRDLRPGRDFTITPLNPLLQIESISYLSDDSYIYTTEYHSEQGPSPIVQVQCLKESQK